MTSHRDSRKRRRTQTASSVTGGAAAGTTSAQIIHFEANPMRRRPGRKASSSPEVENLLNLLKIEVTMAIGVSRGLGETLARFQTYLTAVDNEIERGEILQLQATIRKQTTNLRASVLAASADLQHLLPDVMPPNSDARSDLIYS